MDFPVTEAFVESANATQLHSEAKGAKQNWPASFTQVDGQWVYRVDRDDIDAAFVQAAIDNHVPDENYGKDAEELKLEDYKAKAEAGTLTSQDIGPALALFLKLRA